MRRFLDRHGHIPIERVNMTPMIDVTFLLLTFFMVTSHFASAEKVEIDLPHPDHNQSVEQKLIEKVIINLEYTEDSDKPIIRIGALAVESDEDFIKRLRRVAVRALLRGARRREVRQHELVADPDVVTLDGVGHYPQVEAPERVLDALLAFVDRVELRSLSP